MNNNILEPNINGLPPITDWQKVFLVLQQANEAFLRGATLKDIGKQIIGDVEIQGSDFYDLPVATSSTPVALPIPTVSNKFGFLANGKYSQPTGGTLEYSATQWGLTLFDGTKWLKKFTLDLPQVDTSTLVAKSDIKSQSVNMFDKGSMVLLNTLINSSGGVQTATGWHCAKIDVANLTVGQAISFFGKTGAQGLYYAFYNGSTLLSFAGYNPTLAKTVTKPTDATLLYIDIKTPADADATVYSNFMVNLGASIKPYQAYDAYISAIGDKKIPTSNNGGQAYDQTLNTTDSVKFESVLANDVEVEGTLKSGTISNPPAGLVSGEFWLDVTDSTTHPILRRMA